MPVKFNTNQIRVNCYKLILSPALWLTLGYRGVPRQGKFFQFFRPRWRVDLDKTVQRELLSMYSAAFFVAGVAEDPTPARLVDAYTENWSLSKALQFTSQSEGKQYLSTSIDKYISAKPSGWGACFLLQTNMPKIPNKRWQHEFMRGALYAIGPMDWPIACLKDAANNWDDAKSANPFYPSLALLGKRDD